MERIDYPRSPPAPPFQLRSNSTISPAWQVSFMALETPLAAFNTSGLLKGDAADLVRPGMFRKARDRTAFAGGVASFEPNRRALTGVLDPRRQVEPFGQERAFLTLLIPSGCPESEGTAASPPDVDQFATGAAWLTGRPGRGACVGSALWTQLPPSNKSNRK